MTTLKLEAILFEDENRILCNRPELAEAIGGMLESHAAAQEMNLSARIENSGMNRWGYRLAVYLEPDGLVEDADAMAEAEVEALGDVALMLALDGQDGPREQMVPWTWRAEIKPRGAR
jgi:hypothetical protein